MLLEDHLKPNDWENSGLTPHQVAKNIIQEFEDRYPEFVRVMKRRNEIRNPPRLSEATIAKRDARREANKDKFEAKFKSKQLYKKYMRLKRTKDKQAFNRKHGRYGALKVKGPRFEEKEMRKWQKEKRDTYRAGRKHR